MNQDIATLVKSLEYGVSAPVANSFVHSMRTKNYDEAKQVLREELQNASEEQLDQIIEHYKPTFTTKIVKMVPVERKDIKIFDIDDDSKTVKYLVRVGNSIFVTQFYSSRHNKEPTVYNHYDSYQLADIEQFFEIIEE